MKVTSVKIDVTKIDKSRLFKGKKGTYLDAVIVWSDAPDQYGNDGFIAESVSEEERKNGVKGTILGNVKNMGNSKPPVEINNEVDDDLPF